MFRLQCFCSVLFLNYSAVTAGYFSVPEHSGESEERQKQYQRSHAEYLTRYLDDGRILKAQKHAEAVPLKGNLPTYAGYLTVDKPTNSNMFFWYIPVVGDVKVPDVQIPVILWLQGGLGASSMYGALLLNGPYLLDSVGSLVENGFTWANHAHMLYIDSPVGAGFSFTVSEFGYSKNETHVGYNLYLALIQFFTLFPYLQKNPFIIAGEGYAAKHLTSLGMAIHCRNSKEKLKLNLQGMAIGNGWVDPISMLDFDDVMFYHGLLDTSQLKIFNTLKAKMKLLIHQEDFETAYSIYDSWINGESFPYPTLYYNLTGLEQVGEIEGEKLLFDFFNKDRNGWKLNVGKRRISRSPLVERYLRSDYMKSAIQQLAFLVDHYRVLIYNGQLNIKCAYALTENYLNKMVWKGTKDYRKAVRHKWIVDDKIAGYIKAVGNLSQLLVLNAGHLVSRDRPKLAEHMIRAFAYNLPFNGDLQHDQMHNMSNSESFKRF